MAKQTEETSAPVVIPQTQIDALGGAAAGGTDGPSAPVPASGGTGQLGWQSSMTKVLQDAWDSANHWLNVSLKTALTAAIDSITNYPFGHTVTGISTATTTAVASGAGVVDAIRVCGGTMGNVTVYDNTAASGTILVPTVTPVSGAVLLTNGRFGNGLTIVTAAATVITVTTRPA